MVSGFVRTLVMQGLDSVARVAGLGASVLLVSAALTGCGPTYPNCESDDHCKSKGEYCLNNKCAQCRIDSQCPGADTDKCVTCDAGACGRRADCCSSNLDCGAGKKCDTAANKCVNQCAADTDCPAGQKCSAKGACEVPAGSVAAGGGCKGDTECSAGLKCRDGKCVDEQGQCVLMSINFGFNEYSLTDAAQSTLSANLKCFKEKPPASITVEGHCDERGTDAYNMELGTKRAKAVKDYLQASMPKVKVKTMSYGKTRPVCSEESEDCWGRNRRAEFKAADK
jgi:peptidoglycan-associated lipoprotein